MEWLKKILGEELFAQVSEKINAHNGNEANKDKQIKIGNLGSGEYVGKGKYDALQALLDGKTTELDTANGLIAELKNANKGNEDLQGKITAYETQIGQLQEQLKQTQLDSAVNIGLLAAGVKPDDIDYVAFKLKAKGELELDKDGNIKGWNDKIEALKTQFPTQFENSGGKVYEENKLNSGDDTPRSVTKEQFLQMGYNERMKLKEENEQLFRKLNNN